MIWAMVFMSMSLMSWYGRFNEWTAPSGLFPARRAGPFGFASPTYVSAISPNGRYVVGTFNPGGVGYARAYVFDTVILQFRALPQDER